MGILCFHVSIVVTIMHTDIVIGISKGLADELVFVLRRLGLAACILDHLIVHITKEQHSML